MKDIDVTKCYMCDSKEIYFGRYQLSLAKDQIPLCEKHYIKVIDTPYDRRGDMNEVVGGTRKGIIKSSRTFGCELECLAPHQTNMQMAIKEIPKEFAVKGDGSITYGDYQFSREIPTCPLKGIIGEKTLIDSCKTLIEYGVFTNESCGTHCHIGIPEAKKGGEKNEALLKNLAMFYTIFEPAIRALLPKNRRDNHFCSPIRNQYIHIDKKTKCLCGESKDENDFSKLFYQTKDEPRLKSRKDSHSYRGRNGINFNSMYYRGTLEIRYHQGTLDALQLVHWIAVHAAIIDIVMDGDIKQHEILSYAKIDNVKELFDKLLFLIENNITDETEQYTIERYNSHASLNKNESVENQYVTVVEKKGGRCRTQ